MNTLTAQKIQTSAPAKLILSGEHAILYGASALGMAFHDYHTTTTLLSNQGEQTRIKLENFKTEHVFDDLSLQSLKQEADARFTAALEGKLSVSKVLPAQALVPYILACYAEQYETSCEGLSITVSSTVPVGSGLGSSAACIVSVLRALSMGFENNLSDSDFISLAQQIEHLVHGKSSGLDIQLVFQEACLYYNCGKYHTYPLPTFPFQMAYTGKPESDTAACIQTAAVSFQASDTLPSEFDAVTQGVLKGITQKNLSEIMKNIAINHRLLCDIGVVPDKVKVCITQIEERGNAAKICGAGTCQGEQAGVLFIVGENPVADILAQYDYFRLGHAINRGEFHD